MMFGDVTEFTLSQANTLSFYQELSAFLVLGLTCGLVAVVMMRTIFWADDVTTRWQVRFAIPRYLRPTFAGLALGVLAITFPHIIGVGYETTSAALTGSLLWHEALVFAVLKVVAVAIAMADRMGAGYFRRL